MLCLYHDYKWQQKAQINEKIFSLPTCCAAEIRHGSSTATTINGSTIKFNRFITDNWMQLDLETKARTFSLPILLMKIYTSTREYGKWDKALER